MGSRGHSSNVLKKQVTNIEKSSNKTLEALDNAKKIAIQINDALKQNDLTKFIELINSIVYGNLPSQISEDYNSTVTYSEIQGGWEGEGNIDADPLFVNPANGNLHLQHMAAGQAANSPCIDTGDPSTVPFGTTRTDRVADEGVIDMGYHSMDTTPFDGWYVNSSNGHWYRLTDIHGSWDDCEAEAILYEGHLVTIRDAAEADWVAERFFSPYSSLSLIHI